MSIMDIGLPHSTSHSPILILQSAKLDSGKYQSLSYWFDTTMVRTHEAQIPDLPIFGKWTLNSFGHPMMLLLFSLWPELSFGIFCVPISPNIKVSIFTSIYTVTTGAFIKHLHQFHALLLCFKTGDRSLCYAYAKNNSYKP